MSATTMPGEDGGLRMLYDRIEAPGGLNERISNAEHKIDKHEAICAVRYEALNSQLWWMRWLMIALLAATVLEPRTVVTAVLKQWGVEVSSVPKPGAAAKTPGG